MNTPNRRASTFDQLGAYLEHIGQTNWAIARVVAFCQLCLLALAAVNLRNLVSSPLCWLGIASGTVVAFLLWALLTRRMTVRGALVGIGLWLVIEFALGLFVPWDPHRLRRHHRRCHHGHDLELRAVAASRASREFSLSCSLSWHAPEGSTSEGRPAVVLVLLDYDGSADRATGRPKMKGGGPWTASW